MAADLDLKQLQQQFQAYVRFADSAVEDRIVSTPTLDAKMRLDIYRNAYYARFNEVLEADYPVLAHSMGESWFYQLCCAYSDNFPSQYRSINDFGQHLSVYIGHQDAVLRDDDGDGRSFERQFLVELASFEWALARAFHAADVASVVGEHDLAVLPAEAWPGLCFGFHPSVQVLQQSWNILSYWNSVKEWLSLTEQEGSAQNIASEIPQPMPKTRSCLIWRQGLITGFRSINDLEAAALECLMDGQSFSAMCAIIGAHSDDPEQASLQAAGLLKTWIGSEMVAELRY